MRTKPQILLTIRTARATPYTVSEEYQITLACALGWVQEYSACEDPPTVQVKCAGAYGPNWVALEEIYPAEFKQAIADTKKEGYRDYEARCEDESARHYEESMYGSDDY